MGRGLVDVGVDEVVALLVELEEAEGDTGCVVVNTDVAVEVFPAVTNVERDVEVTTVKDGEGDTEEDEFVELELFY